MNCSIEDTRLFCQLLKSGYSFTQCLDYLEDEGNHECFLWAKQKMKQGEPIEEWGCQFFCRSIQSYLDCFLKFLPITQALELSVTLYDQKETDQKEFIKMTGYPVAMFLFSLAGVQLFCLLCMPSLIQMMKGFDVSTLMIEGIYHILMLCAFALTVMLITTAGLVCYYLMPQHIVEGIELIYRCNMGFLIQRQLSNHFALVYYHCVRMGIHTRTALQMLKNCTSQPLFCFLAEHVDLQLSKGNDLVEAVGIQYLDASFQKLMRTIVLSASALNLLEGYLKVADAKRRKSMKQIGQLIQTIAYLFIAIMIVLVYQVLFLPLSMLERM